MFGIFKILDLPPELSHKKHAVLPVFLIGGPDPPKHIDSFMYPTLAHLAACQNLGLRVWDSITDCELKCCLWYGFGTADTVRMAGLVTMGGMAAVFFVRCLVVTNQVLEHTILSCSSPDGCTPPGSSHDNIDINSIQTPEVQNYNDKLASLLAACTQTEYERLRKETGLTKPSLISGLLKTIPPPKCFPADTMHLFGLNLPQLIIFLFCGTIEHSRKDNPKDWPFAVLHKPKKWQAHGQDIRDLQKYIPCCIEKCVLHNSAEKISSGYKAVEYLIYVYRLLPASL